jgi:hypothetical protein
MNPARPPGYTPIFVQPMLTTSGAKELLFLQVKRSHIATADVATTKRFLVKDEWKAAW